jgi:hypothetical protein
LVVYLHWVNLGLELNLDLVALHALSPTYRIYMGAIAISVLAAAQFRASPDTLTVLLATPQVVSGLAFLF